MENIRCQILDEKINCSIGDDIIRIRVESLGGLSGHVHANKSILDSIIWDEFFKTFLMSKS